MHSTSVLPAASIISSGVDWLTVTCSDHRRRADLLGLGHALINDAMAYGEKTSLLKAHGYLGVASSHCAVGERREDAYLRISGDAAHYNWRAATSAATNVSRLDVQTTVAMASPWSNWSAELYETLSLWAELHSQRTAVSRLYDRAGGATVYCGRRSSGRYGRVYDKGVESGSAAAGTTIRYEWEYKADLANRIVATIDANEDAGAACRDLIAAELARRNVVPPGFGPSDRHLPIVGRPLPDENRTRLYFLRIARAGIKRELLHATPDEVIALLDIPHTCAKAY